MKLLLLNAWVIRENSTPSGVSFLNKKIPFQCCLAISSVLMLFSKNRDSFKKAALVVCMLILSLMGFSQNCARITSFSLAETSTGNYHLVVNWNADGQKWIGVRFYCGNTLSRTECISISCGANCSGSTAFNFACAGTIRVVLTRNTGTCGHGTECDSLIIDPQYGPLPITLLNFTATRLSNTVRLNWETSQEVNSKHFDVEYSKDGVNWQSIGIVNAAGNSAAARLYSFIHNSPVKGVNYYRLKMVDINASFKNSPTHTVTFGGKNTITILPNPTTDKVFISSTAGVNLQSIALYTIEGKLIKTISNFILGSSIDMHSYPRGIYMLKIVDKDGNSEIIRVAKE